MTAIASLSQEELQVLGIINRAQNPVSTSAIALELSTDPIRAKSLINELWEKQLVGRAPKSGVDYWHVVPKSQQQVSAILHTDSPPPRASTPTRPFPKDPEPEEDKSESALDFSIRQYSIQELAELRKAIVFPSFQRQDDVWGSRKRTLLIDSIMRGFDLPKFYFFSTEKGELSCIDGRQRLAAIFSLFDGDLRVDSRYWKDFTADEKRTFLARELTFSVIKGASDEDLRTVFLRLQLGMVLSAGEKLGAETSPIRDWLLELSAFPIFGHLGVSLNRKSALLLSTRIANQVYDLDNELTPSSTDYKTLRYFLKSQKEFDANSAWVLATQDVLRRMESAFGVYATAITSIGDALSVATLFAAHPKESQSKLKEFVLDFIAKKARVRAGTNLGSIPSQELLLLSKYVQLATGAANNTAAGVKHRADILEEFWLKSQRKGGS